MLFVREFVQRIDKKKLYIYKSGRCGIFKKDKQKKDYRFRPKLYEYLIIV